MEVVYPEIDFGVDAVPNFHELMAELTAQGKRVVPVNYIGDIAWVVLRYEDVAAAYADDENLPAAAAYERHSLPTQGRTLLAMSGEEHRVNRLLVSKAFHPPAIRKLADSTIIPLCNELVDSFVGKTELDLVADFTHRFPFSVITRMLGLPDTDHEQLVDWVDGLFSYPTDPERGLRAKADFTAYIEPLVNDRRNNPGDDLVSMLATAEAEGQRLENEEIYSFIRLLFPAGADTTFLSIGSMMLTVLEDRDLYRRLMDKTEDRIWAVEESLRRDGTIGLQPRYTENAVTIAGVEIPANSVMLYATSPSNRDPDVFPEPHTFDVDRHPSRILTFGKGVHFCLGSHLARTEMQVALSVLLDRLSGLRLQRNEYPQRVSAVLRGPRKMLVEFDEVLPAEHVRYVLRVGKHS